MSWTAPYGPGDTKLIYEGSGQLTNVAYSYDGRTMFVSDSGAVIAHAHGRSVEAVQSRAAA